MKKHLSLIFLLVTIISFSPAQENTQQSNLNLFGSGDVFKIDLVTDSILFGTGVALNGTYLLCDKVLKTKNVPFDGNILDKSQVNTFDQPLMNPYSKKLDDVGDLFLITGMISPALFAVTPKDEWFTILTMYAETALIANGIKELAKLAVDRPRPYMYFEDYPQKEVYRNDWCKSFPSGHSTMTFTAAAFNTFVFCKYFPDSPWRYAVIGGSYAIAITTASRRLASGNHFATDVLTGAALGTLCGFLVPYLHTLNANNSKDSHNISNASVSTNIIPTGFSISLRF